MEKAGLGEWRLMRADGYFYTFSEKGLGASIFVCFFNQLTINQWMEAIAESIENAIITK